MNVWEKHAERMRRQRQLERFDRWCLAHPWRARVLAIGIAILVGEVAMFLRHGIDFLANRH